MIIDYGILAEAAYFYTERGYRQLEVPWMVKKEISQITCPNEAYAFVLNEASGQRALVWSAEMGFLERYEQLQPARPYFSVSPCFRNEPIQDETHQLNFMKLELFVRAANHVERFINDAVDFYREYHAGGEGEIRVEQTGDKSFDVMLGQIEIGSYSFYERNGMIWSCGTGLALPRFEVAEVKSVRRSKPKWAGNRTDDEIWASLAELEE